MMMYDNVDKNCDVDGVVIIVPSLVVLRLYYSCDKLSELNLTLLSL